MVLLCLPALTVAAEDVPEVTLTQVTAGDAGPLPRPTVDATKAGDASLPFHLALTYRCPAGSQYQQLFVSIADTTRLEPAAAMQPAQTMRLDVPLGQLRWLTERDLSCGTIARQRTADEVGASSTRYFRLHAGTTGFATVLCAGKDGQVASATATTPLDIWLSCPAGSP